MNIARLGPAALLLALLFAGPGTSSASDLQIVKDPDAVVRDLMQNLGNGQPGAFATKVTTLMGVADRAESIAKSMSVLEGKRASFTAKIFDTEIAGALRQIVYYAHTPDIGFVYYRFNLKMTGGGWVLTNFYFKEETQALLPPDLVQR